MRNIVLSCLVIFGLVACDNQNTNVSRNTGSLACTGGEDISIISGSENEALAPFLADAERSTGVDLCITYKGSVDIMLALQDPNFAYDATWAAQSLWVELGDERQNRVKHTKSIMTSPVVLGVKKSTAERLGWVGKNVTMKEIYNAVNRGDLKFGTTSATQSNSGASTYVAFATALAGVEVLTTNDINNPKLREKMANFYQKGVSLTSGSSKWLADAFVADDKQVAMFNYESIILDVNREMLVPNGKEPLYIIYPVDGMAIADSPLSFVKHSNSQVKEENFLKVQNYLLSAEVQNKILSIGRRAGAVGTMTVAGDPTIFPKEWGVDLNRVIQPITFPRTNVIREMLAIYQGGDTRKPSITVFAVDYSGSMSGYGETSLEQAMTIMLDQKIAAEYMIQTGSKDITIVIPFNGAVIDIASVTGNNANDMTNLLNWTNNHSSGGGTNIYSAVLSGLQLIKSIPNIQDYQPAIVLMTDGASDGYSLMSEIVAIQQQIPVQVPVFSIKFGSADESQLLKLAGLTSSKTRDSNSPMPHARVFDGKDLANAFRQAKGYN